MKKLFTLPFLLLTIQQLAAQGITGLKQINHADSLVVPHKTTGNSYLQLAFEHGGILAIDDNPKVNAILKSSNFNGISLRYSWEIKSSSIYHSVYRRPLLGVGLMTSTFHNPVIGAPISVFGFVEIPFSKVVSRWNFSYGLALGLSFHFNPYDTINNPQNLMISSHYNAYLHAILQANYVMSKNWQIGIGIGYKHYSNGATKKPNAGINLMPVQLSARYKIDHALKDNIRSLPAFKPFVSLGIYTASGMKQNNPGEELIYKNLTGLFLGYQFSYKYKLGLGFDLTYSSGGTHRLPASSAFSANFSYGIYAGWEWYITDRLYIPINLGLYLHHNRENSETTLFYERLGLRYLFFNHHFSVGPSLKAHAGTADFIEFNLGWTFHHNKNSYQNN